MSSKPPNPPASDADSEKSWDLAKRYANQVNPVPFQITMAIKSLRRLHDDSSGAEVSKVPPEANTAIRLIEKTPNLKTPLYFAASTIFPERFKLAEDDTSKALLLVLQPGLFASLLGLVYLYRRIGKIAPGDVFEMLSKDILINLEMGMLLGREIKEVGFADGSLIGGIRHLAVGTYMLRDSESYTKYKNLKKHRLDPEHERAKWGCDHAQVAAYMLQSLGFPWDLRKTRRALLAEINHPDLDPYYQKFARIIYWLDSIKDGSKDSSKLGSFNVTEKAFSTLLQDCSRVFMGGSSLSWMERGRQIPEKKPPAPAPASQQVISPSQITLPGITQEELAELSQDELRQLLDYQQELEQKTAKE